MLSSVAKLCLALILVIAVKHTAGVALAEKRDSIASRKLAGDIDKASSIVDLAVGVTSAVFKKDEEEDEEEEDEDEDDKFKFVVKKEEEEEEEEEEKEYYHFKDGYIVKKEEEEDDEEDESYYYIKDGFLIKIKKEEEEEEEEEKKFIIVDHKIIHSYSKGGKLFGYKEEDDEDDEKKDYYCSFYAYHGYKCYWKYAFYG